MGAGIKIGGLDEVFKALVNAEKDISHEELERLLHKIENDANSLCKEEGIYNIRFLIEKTPNEFNVRLGRQNKHSLECIREAIRRNLDQMQGFTRLTFEAYLSQLKKQNQNRKGVSKQLQ